MSNMDANDLLKAITLKTQPLNLLCNAWAFYIEKEIFGFDSSLPAFLISNRCLTIGFSMLIIKHGVLIEK